MKPPVIFLLIVLVCIAALVLLPLFLRPPIPDNEIDRINTFKRQSLYFDYEITQIPASAKVTHEINLTGIDIGVSIDPWDLNFGSIPRGGSFGTRKILLRNLKDEPAKIGLYSSGNISPLVKFQDDSFVLQPGQELNTEINLITGKNTELGSYNGRIDLVVRRHRFDVLQNILGGF